MARPFPTSPGVCGGDVLTTSRVPGEDRQEQCCLPTRRRHSGAPRQSMVSLASFSILLQSQPPRPSPFFFPPPTLTHSSRLAAQPGPRVGQTLTPPQSMVLTHSRPPPQPLRPQALNPTLPPQHPSPNLLPAFGPLFFLMVLRSYHDEAIAVI